MSEYLGQRVLGSTLTFYANTTRFDTGNATDADALPTYRVYKEETTIPILTGTMALLDPANTDGFYSEQITLSTANGFENGKDYCIRVQATVNAVTDADRRTFRVGTGAVAGAIAFTYTVTNLQTGANLEGVEVWITLDSAGSQVIWNGHTDASGVARDDNNDLPYLDAGVYYFWSQRVGFTFNNPDQETVS